MSLTVQLTPELEAGLREQAKLLGQPVERIALDAIEERLAGEFAVNTKLSREEWHRRFDALIASMPTDGANLDADLSRTSAYRD